MPDLSRYPPRTSYRIGSGIQYTIKHKNSPKAFFTPADSFSNVSPFVVDGLKGRRRAGFGETQFTEKMKIPLK